MLQVHTLLAKHAQDGQPGPSTLPCALRIFTAATQEELRRKLRELEGAQSALDNEQRLTSELRKSAGEERQRYMQEAQASWLKRAAQVAGHLVFDLWPGPCCACFQMQGLPAVLRYACTCLICASHACCGRRAC